MPERVWQRRVKGARIGDAVSVVRGTKYGNPFIIATATNDSELARDQAIAMFRAYALEKLDKDPQWLEPLRDKDLACYCRPGLLCHADVLIELANRLPSR